MNLSIIYVSITDAMFPPRYIYWIQCLSVSSEKLELGLEIIMSNLSKKTEELRMKNERLARETAKKKAEERELARRVKEMEQKLARMEREKKEKERRERNSHAK